MHAGGRNVTNKDGRARDPDRHALESAGDTPDQASRLAIEALFWQLVVEGVLKSEPLAAELERYSRYAGRGGERLKKLAHMVRYAGSPEKHRRQRNHVPAD